MSQSNEIEEARRQAEPSRWTVQGLIDKLPHVHTFWMRDAMPHFGGDRAELEKRLLALRDQQKTDLARTYMGLVLFFLGHADGQPALLTALRSDTQKVRLLALDTFRVLKWDDVGTVARPGALHLTDVDVFEALDWTLEDPTSQEGRLGLEYAIKFAFDPARSMLAALLRHPDTAVRDKVLETFLARGHDDGALDVLGSELLGRGIEKRAAEQAWRNARRSDTVWLFHGVKNTKDPVFRERAADLAQRVLRDALAAKDAPARFDGNTGWLTSRTLVQALARAKASGAAALLQSMVSAQRLPATMRAQAAAAFKELTGEAPAGAKEAVREAVERDPCDHTDKLLERLHAHDLLDVNTAVAAVGTSWSFEVTPLLAKWHGGRENEVVGKLLVERLRALAAEARGSAEPLKRVVDLLRGIGYSAEARDAAVATLRAALMAARERYEKGIVGELQRLLVSLGDTNAAELAQLAPWDATWAHWQAQRWTAADIAELLREAGIVGEIPATDLDGIRVAVDRPEMTLFKIFDKAGKRDSFQSIRDDGFQPPHDKLFSTLVRSVRPEVPIEAVSQKIDSKMTELTPEERAKIFTRMPGGDVPIDEAGLADVPVYSSEGSVGVVTFVHENQVRRFGVRCDSSWMDVAGVMRAFDDFMQSIARPERAYYLETASWASPEFGVFVAADPERFTPMNEELCLPLDAQFHAPNPKAD